MTTAGEIEFLIGLLAVVALLAQLARMVSVPYPIFLVLAGLGLGLTPGLPRIELPPEIIFLVFIPPLILSAAFSSSPRELRRHVRPIALQAVGLVFATIGAVAIAAHYAIGLPWAVAFVLGAVVAPTDPVASEATFKRLGVPERVSTVVSGESLINDGSALVAYRIALGAVGAGTFSVLAAGAEFVFSGIGGVAIGLFAGWLSSHVYRRLTDPALLVLTTLIPAYVVYIAAERVHASGIIAVVALGLYIGWQAPKVFTPETRLQSYSFWEVLTFLLDSLLFVLIGLQFPAILAGLREPIGEVLLYAALVCGAVVGLRLLWLLLVPLTHPVLDRILPGTYLRGTWRERLVIGWSGMRGAISLAAALSVPLTVSGNPFPGRDLLLFLTVCVIFVTLIVQGLTLPVLIRTLNVRDESLDDTRMEELQARFEATRAALDQLESMSGDGEISSETQQSLRELYEGRLQRYESGLQAGRVTEEYAQSSGTWSRWRHELFKAEREAVLAMRDQGKISAEVMRRVERDIDLEELRFSG